MRLRRLWRKLLREGAVNLPHGWKVPMLLLDWIWLCWLLADVLLLLRYLLLRRGLSRQRHLLKPLLFKITLRQVKWRLR